VRVRLGLSLALLFLLSAWYWSAPTSVEAQLPSAEAPVIQDTDRPADAPPTTKPPRDPKSYGLWVLTPAVLAIVLTILTRQVVAALFLGVLVGAVMYVPCLPADSPFQHGSSVVTTARLMTEHYIIGAVHEYPKTNFDRIKVIAFTFFVAFMVGVIGRNGGTAGLVRLVAGESASPRRGALTAWIAGMVVFFDDYANCMIIGPTMRRVFDRVKQSRAMLAYIVHSTAPTDASLAIIGTWIGAVVAYIQTGLPTAAETPAFMMGADGSPISAMTAFIQSLPYRFYPILAIVCCLFVVLLGRDFGPMRRSQDRAVSRVDREQASAEQAEAIAARSTWWLGFFPIAVMVAVTVVILLQTGLAAGGREVLNQSGLSWWQNGAEIIGRADSYLSILYGSLLAAIVAIVLTLFARTCSLAEAMDAGLGSMAHTIPALTILVFAWALSQIEQDLLLGQILTDKLQQIHFPAVWLPFAISMVAYLISFTTGTSWGTMGILCPIMIPVAIHFAETLPPQQGLALFYASVGSVLGGAIFGDHCSPLSSTTVLSAIGADCPLIEHTWTQLPYAILSGVAALGFGDVMCNVYGWPWYAGLAAGSALMFLVILLLGRRAKPSFELIDGA